MKKSENQKRVEALIIETNELYSRVILLLAAIARRQRFPRSLPKLYPN